jgi:hypothetical protein
MIEGKLYRYKVTGKLYRFARRLDAERLLFDPVDPPEKPGDLQGSLVVLPEEMELVVEKKD